MPTSTTSPSTERGVSWPVLVLLLLFVGSTAIFSGIGTDDPLGSRVAIMLAELVYSGWMPAAYLRGAFGRFLAMQLDRVELASGDCFCQQTVVRIDEQAHLADPITCSRCQLRGQRRRDIARGGGVKDETDMRRMPGNRSIQCVGSRDSADFYGRGRHGPRASLRSRARP